MINVAVLLHNREFFLWIVLDQPCCRTRSYDFEMTYNPQEGTKGMKECPLWAGFRMN